jgi:hypothetical protein
MAPGAPHHMRPTGDGTPVAVDTPTCRPTGCSPTASRRRPAMGSTLTCGASSRAATAATGGGRSSSPVSGAASRGPRQRVWTVARGDKQRGRARCGIREPRPTLQPTRRPGRGVRTSLGLRKLHGLRRDRALLVHPARRLLPDGTRRAFGSSIQRAAVVGSVGIRRPRRVKRVEPTRRLPCLL